MLKHTLIYDCIYRLVVIHTRNNDTAPLTNPIRSAVNKNTNVFTSINHFHNLDGLISFDILSSNVFVDGFQTNVVTPFRLTHPQNVF